MVRVRTKYFKELLHVFIIITAISTLLAILMILDGSAEDLSLIILIIAFEIIIYPPWIVYYCFTKFRKRNTLQIYDGTLSYDKMRYAVSSHTLMLLPLSHNIYNIKITDIPSQFETFISLGKLNRTNASLITCLFDEHNLKISNISDDQEGAEDIVEEIVQYDPKIRFYENTISGDIGGFGFKGLVFNNNKIIIQTYLSQEIDLNILHELKRPSFIYDVRLKDTTLEFLTEVPLYSYKHADAYFEELAAKLKHNGIYYIDQPMTLKQNQEYKYTKIIFTVAMMIVFSFVFDYVIFNLQLGRLLWSSQTSIRVSYYTSAGYALLPILLCLISVFLNSKLHIFNQFEKKDKIALNILTFTAPAIIIPITIFTSIIYQSHLLFGYNFSYSLQGFADAIHHLNRFDYTDIYVMNIIACGIVLISYSMFGIKEFLSLRKST